MQVNHHLSVHIDPLSKPEFGRLGIDIAQHKVDGYSSFAVIDILESDPRWTEVAKLLKPLKILDIVSTQFSPGELDGAAFSTCDWAWTTGYPQPEDAYKEVTYDLTNYCSVCGTGRIQNAPFRMVGEPRWGRRSLLRLNWVPDEIFTTPEVWATVFKPFGLQCRPVVKHQTGLSLQTCVQIVVDNEVELRIPKELPSEYCPVCRQTRWNIFRRGLFPGPAESPTTAMFRSSQYFGAGHLSHKHVLVSNLLYREIAKHNLKGVEFAACEG